MVVVVVVRYLRGIAEGSCFFHVSMYASVWLCWQSLPRGLYMYMTHRGWDGMGRGYHAYMDQRDGYTALEPPLMLDWLDVSSCSHFL